MFHISSHPIPYAGIVPTSNSRNGTMPTCSTRVGAQHGQLNKGGEAHARASHCTSPSLTKPTRANTSAATVTLPRVLASRPRKLRCSSSSWNCKRESLLLLLLTFIFKIKITYSNGEDIEADEPASVGPHHLENAEAEMSLLVWA